MDLLASERAETAGRGKAVWLTARLARSVVRRLSSDHRRDCGCYCQASERDSSKPGGSFFSAFSISADSRIAPQSRHSTYLASLSSAMIWVRLCWQAGWVIAESKL